MADRRKASIPGALGGLILITPPFWAHEGYPDRVARESSLSNGQAAALRRVGASPRALAYHDGRRRVERTLAADGGSVDRLSAGARR